MSSDEPREYMGGAAKQIHDVLMGGARLRRPQVVKKPTTISRVPSAPRPIIDYAAPVRYDAAPRPGAPVQEPPMSLGTVPVRGEYGTPQIKIKDIMPYVNPMSIGRAPEPPIIDYAAPVSVRYADPRPYAPVQEPMTVATDAPPYYLYSVDEYGNDIMSINPIYLNQRQIYYDKRGSGRTRRPQVVKQSRQSRPVERPIIDYASPAIDSYGEPIQPAYVAPDPQNDYIDVIVPGGTQRVYRGRGAGRRRKHRSPSSSSDEGMEGGWISSLFNVGKAVASAATRVVPRATTTVTRGATTAVSTATKAAPKAIDAAADAAAAAAKAAASAASKPVTLGTRLMNTASGLGNFGILAANIAAPIYMSVDQAQNTQRMIEAQRKADAENARLTAQAEADRLEGLKLQEEMKKATEAQWEAYDLATQILKGTYVAPTSGTTTTAPPATPQDVLDILNTITAITNPPPEPPPPASVPVPPGTGNPNVPIPPAPPQPPSIAPTQPTAPPTTLPPPPPPPPPPAPSAPSAPSRPSSNQYRGRGRGRRGGVTHESHKASILQILKAYNR